MTEVGDPPGESSAPERRDYLTIFLLSCSILIFQIALTRVLSVVVWYHFAFLTISIVLSVISIPSGFERAFDLPKTMIPALL